MQTVLLLNWLGRRPPLLPTCTLVCVFLFSASVFAQTGQTTSPDSLAALKAQLEERLRHARAAEANALRALDQARTALAGAERAGDAEAVAIARQAVSIGDRALSKARGLRAAEEAQLEAKRKDSNSGATLSKERPVLLATDAQLAKGVRLRLEEVNGRLSRLKKAIEILGADNPEWDKEWADVRKDMIENSHRLLWVSLDMLTLDLAEAFKYSAQLDAAAAQSLFGENAWGQIAAQKESLARLRRTWVGTGGVSIDKWIAQLDSLQRAAARKNVAECIGILRDAIADGGDIYRHAKAALESTDTATALYDASAALGEISIIFVKGIGAKVAPAAAFVARGIEAGLLLKLLWEDKRQFRELSDRTYDRRQKKLELLRRVADLEEEKAGLEWALSRAGSK